MMHLQPMCKRTISLGCSTEVQIEVEGCVCVENLKWEEVGWWSQLSQSEEAGRTKKPALRPRRCWLEMKNRNCSNHVFESVGDPAMLYELEEIWKLFCALSDMVSSCRNGGELSDLSGANFQSAKQVAITHN